MITLHFHLLPQYKYELFHIYFTYRHMSANGLYSIAQSAYRANHSTETALLKMKKDILLNMNKQLVALFVLLDLIAAMLSF